MTRVRISVLQMWTVLKVTRRNGQVEHELLADGRAAELDVEVSDADADAIAQRLAGSGR